MHPEVTLGRDEDVIGLVRRRFLFELPRFTFGLVWTFGPCFFFFPLLALGPFGWGMFVLMVATGGRYLARRYRMWRQTFLLITTHRVIDVDQLGWKKSHVGELAYEAIDAIRVEYASMMGRWLRTGRIHVETSSAHQFDLEITGVHHPDRVRELLLDVQYFQQQHQVHDPKKRTIKIA